MMNWLFLLLSPYMAPLVALTKMMVPKASLRKTVWQSLMTCFMIWTGFISIINHSVGGLVVPLILYSMLNLYDHVRHSLIEKGFEHWIDAFLRVSRLFFVWALLEKILSYYFQLDWIQVLYYSHTFVQKEGYYRIYANFGNPNVAGMWFAAWSLMALWRFLSLRPHRIHHGLWAFLHLMALTWTGSKGAFMAYVFALVASLTFWSSWRQKVVAGLVLAVSLTLRYLSSPLSHTVQTRSLIWQKSWDVISNHWLLGISPFHAIPTIGEVHSHNLWLSVWLFFGLVGLVIILSMQVYCLTRAWTYHKKKDNRVSLVIMLTALIGAHSLVDFTLISPHGMVLLMVYAAFLTTERDEVTTVDHALVPLREAQSRPQAEPLYTNFYFTL